MNDVHKAVAGKLRSAADALRADASSQPHDNFGDRVNEALHSEANRIQNRADEFDLKPAIEEPEEFGSVVRAGIDGISDRVLWLRSASGYWFSETSRRAIYNDLYHPEVLRIGVGEAWVPRQDFIDDLVDEFMRTGLDPQGRREAFHLFAERLMNAMVLGDTTADEAPADVDELMTSAGFVRTPAQEAYAKGAADMKANALVVVRKLAFTAITAEQAGAYDKAAQAIGDLS